MEIKVTTLSENTANYGFLAEWGLSILVEVDGMRILMDTGLSFSAVHNAQLMGVDLTTIDRIVLSHGRSSVTCALMISHGNYSRDNRPFLIDSQRALSEGTSLVQNMG
jgi:metal-dependent hydrolase (beta-lactamase superfamily II)